MEHLNEEKLEEQIHGNTAIVYHTTRWGDVDTKTRDKLSKPNAAATMPQLVVEALEHIPLLTSWVNDKDKKEWLDDIMAGHINDREHKATTPATPTAAAPAAIVNKTNYNQASGSAPVSYWRGIGRFTADGYGAMGNTKVNPDPRIAADRVAQQNLYNSKQTWGFRSGSGDCYGRGFYSVFDVDSLHGTTKVGNHGTSSGYGGVVLTFYVNNLSNYLITSWENNNTSDNITHPIMAVNPRVKQNPGRYNENNFIFQQLIDAGVPWSKIARFEERCGFKSNPRDAVYNYGVSQFARDFAPYFEGYIYTEGASDGDVLVTFDIDWILNHEQDEYSDDTKFANPTAAYAYARNKLNPETKLAGKSDEERAELFADPDFKAEYEVQKQEYQKLMTLATNFHNMKSIIPVSYSFDKGASQFPIRISPEIKRKINLLRNAYKHLEVKLQNRKSTSDEILRAYNRNGSFIIPFNALEYGYISKEDIEKYVADGHGEIILTAGESRDYYNKIIALLQDCHVDHVTMRPNGSGYVDLRDMSDIYDKLAQNGIKCILEVQGNGGVTTIKANSKSMPLLAAITENSPVLTSAPTKNCCIYFEDSADLVNAKAFKVQNTWITQVYTPDTMSMSNIDFFKRNFKALQYIYTGGSTDNINDPAFDGEVIDFKRGIIKVKPTIKSFGGIKKNGSVAFIQKLRFNMKKNKNRKTFSSLFDMKGCQDLLEICEGSIKHVAEFDQIILSPTKDKKFSRTESCIPGSKKIGYEQLSIIGPVNVIGNGPIIAKECAMDLSCFNSLKNNSVIALTAFGLFLPSDENIVITRDILDKAAGFAKSGNFKIHIPWSMKSKIRFAEDIPYDEAMKVTSYYDKDYSFGKWIDLANGISRAKAKPKTEEEADAEWQDTSDDNEEGEE